MKVKTYLTEAEWLADRPGRIMGSKLNDLYSVRGGRKLEFYQLIADRLAIIGAIGEESAMERGHRLEVEAIQELSKALNVEFMPCKDMWISDISESIAVSPDGHTDDLMVAAEVKCLKASLHLQALIEQKIAKSAYKLQAIQYFIVNPELQTVFFTFYNPDVTAKPLHWLEMSREDYAEEIEYYTKFELDTLAEVDEWVEKLAF